jgi:predicted nucleic acid-binding protein
MKYVIDSSVGVKWVIPEVDSAKALRLRDDYRHAVVELLAPDFYPFEVANSITRAERQARITQAEGAAALRDTLAHLPQLENVLALLPRAYAISSQTKSAVFDCLYVALAERDSCQLVTADHRVINNLQPHFPYIMALASLP